MNEWISELVYKDGNICCPFCGKPFLHYDFTIITDDMCQHDIKDLLQAYYIAIQALGEISILEGSSYSLTRKAHNALGKIEEITGMNIKKDFLNG